MILQAPHRNTNFDAITKPGSINFLNVFIAKQNEQVSSVLFETEENEDHFVNRNVFSFDRMETDDKIIKQEVFIWSKGVKFLFARGEKNIC